MALTEPQERWLSEIVAAGEKVYNGRARRLIEALEALQLVTCEYDLIPHAIGAWTWRLTVRATEAGRAHAAAGEGGEL